MMMALGLALSASSCSEKLPTESNIIDSEPKMTDFDRWLEENYRAPYNIHFLYRYEDIQTDMAYNLAPAEEIYCRIMAKMLRYLWIDVYSECAGMDFMQKYSPRMLQIIGSGSYNSDGTINIGFAEGGQKISLNVANWLEKENWIRINYHEDGGYDVEILDRSKINGYYLHFVHHEYAHILHQTINYPVEFKTISQNDYVAQWTSLSETAAAQKGFVSSYSASGASEDFVEVLSTYVCSTDEAWQNILTRGGDAGAAIIEKKLDIVKSYMNVTWNIDLDHMKSVIDRRFNNINKLDWDNFETAE